MVNGIVAEMKVEINTRFVSALTHLSLKMCFGSSIEWKMGQLNATNWRWSSART